MDNIDLSILKCLKENSRQTASTISQSINLSVSAVIERIRKMEAKGIIQQYTVVLDEKQLGNDLTVFISVRLEHPKYGKDFAEAAAKHCQQAWVPSIQSVLYRGRCGLSAEDRDRLLPESGGDSPGYQGDARRILDQNSVCLIYN